MNDFTAESTAATKEKLASDFRLVMDDIDALMKATAARAEGEMAALRTRISARLDTAKERFGELQTEAVSKARDAARATDSYVHEKPWQAVGAAAALGLAIGVLIGRR